MSFRATISVYIHNEIADIHYCRNWNKENLFIEAAGLMAFFYGISSKREYLEKRYDDCKIGFLNDPESPWAKENLKWMEECSEFTVLTDLTNGYIYQGCTTDPAFVRRYAELSEYDTWPQFSQAYGISQNSSAAAVKYAQKKYRQLRNARYGNYRRQMSDLLDYYLTDMSHCNLEEIRDLYRYEPQLRLHISDSFRQWIRQECIKTQNRRA